MPAPISKPQEKVFLRDLRGGYVHVGAGKKLKLPVSHPNMHRSLLAVTDASATTGAGTTVTNTVLPLVRTHHGRRGFQRARRWLNPCVRVP